MPRVRLDDLKAALESRRLPAARNEAEYKRELVDDINSLPGGRARRVEDKYAVGVLDLIIKLPNQSVILAEGKLIHGNLFAPTDAQFVEGVRWGGAGVKCVLLGWKHGQMFISPWIKQAHVDNCFAPPDLSYAQALQEYLR